MERARVLRFVRIAVTALSLTACVLLVALWVRSYSRFASVPLKHLPSGKRLDLICSDGRVSVRLTQTPGWWKIARRQAIFVPGKGYKINGERGYFDENGKPIRVGSLGTTNQGVPNWCAVIALASLAVVPWLRCRFSLRTLLIATTLVAVGLGLIARSR